MHLVSRVTMIEADAAHLASIDPRLAHDEPIPLGVEVWGGGYPGLVRLILGQLVSIEAADAMWGNLVAAVGEVTPVSIRRADPATLRACGFTARKADYARAIGDAVDGGLDFDDIDRMGDGDVASRLMALPGVGRWTADCYLLFCLGRRDVFPAGDLALPMKVL